MTKHKIQGSQHKFMCGKANATILQAIESWSLSQMTPIYDHKVCADLGNMKYYYIWFSSALH